MKIGTYVGSGDVVSDAGLDAGARILACKRGVRSAGQVSFCTINVRRNVGGVVARGEAIPVAAGGDGRGERLRVGEDLAGLHLVLVTGAGGALQFISDGRVGGAECHEGDEKRQELRGCGRGREGRGR